MGDQVCTPSVRNLPQWDSRWGSTILHDKTDWTDSGCHPSTIAMAMRWFAEDNPATKGTFKFPSKDGSKIDPTFYGMRMCEAFWPDLGGKCNAVGGNVDHAGLKAKAAAALGIDAAGIPVATGKNALANITAALAKGPIVACISHPGHFVLITGVVGGQIRVVDPGNVLFNHWDGMVQDTSGRPPQSQWPNGGPPAKGNEYDQRAYLLVDPTKPYPYKAKNKDTGKVEPTGPSYSFLADLSFMECYSCNAVSSTTTHPATTTTAHPANTTTAAAAITTTAAPLAATTSAPAATTTIAAAPPTTTTAAPAAGTTAAPANSTTAGPAGTTTAASEEGSAGPSESTTAAPAGTTTATPSAATTAAPTDSTTAPGITTTAAPNAATTAAPAAATTAAPAAATTAAPADSTTAAPGTTTTAAASVTTTAAPDSATTSAPAATTTTPGETTTAAVAPTTTAPPSTTTAADGTGTPIPCADDTRTSDALLPWDLEGNEGRWLDVPRLQQQNAAAPSQSSYWSGRAAAAMIYNFWSKFAKKTDEYIGHSDGDTAPGPNGIKTNLRWAGGSNKGVLAGLTDGQIDLTQIFTASSMKYDAGTLVPQGQTGMPEQASLYFQPIIDQLKGNNPVLLFTLLSRGPGHVIVISGYKLIGNGDLWIRVTDSDGPRADYLPTLEPITNPTAPDKMFSEYWVPATAFFQQHPTIEGSRLYEYAGNPGKFMYVTPDATITDDDELVHRLTPHATQDGTGGGTGSGEGTGAGSGMQDATGGEHAGAGTTDATGGGSGDGPKPRPWDVVEPEVINGDFKDAGVWKSGKFTNIDLQGLLEHYCTADSIDPAGMGDAGSSKKAKGGDLEVSGDDSLPTWYCTWRVNVAQRPKWDSFCSARSRIGEAFSRWFFRDLCKQKSADYPLSADEFFANLWKSNANGKSVDMGGPSGIYCAAASSLGFTRALAGAGYTVPATKGTQAADQRALGQLKTLQPASGDVLSIVSPGTPRTGHVVTVILPLTDKLDSGSLWVVSGNCGPRGNVAVDSINLEKRDPSFNPFKTDDNGKVIGAWQSDDKKPSAGKVWVYADQLCSLLMPDKLTSMSDADLAKHSITKSAPIPTPGSTPGKVKPTGDDSAGGGSGAAGAGAATGGSDPSETTTDAPAETTTEPEETTTEAPSTTAAPSENSTAAPSSATTAAPASATTAAPANNTTAAPANNTTASPSITTTAGPSITTTAAPAANTTAAPTGSTTAAPTGSTTAGTKAGATAAPSASTTAAPAATTTQVLIALFAASLDSNDPRSGCGAAKTVHDKWLQFLETVLPPLTNSGGSGGIMAVNNRNAIATLGPKSDDKHNTTCSQTLTNCLLFFGIPHQYVAQSPNTPDNLTPYFNYSPKPKPGVGPTKYILPVTPTSLPRKGDPYIIGGPPGNPNELHHAIFGGLSSSNPYKCKSYAGGQSTWKNYTTRPDAGSYDSGFNQKGNQIYLGERQLVWFADMWSFFKDHGSEVTDTKKTDLK